MKRCAEVSTVGRDTAGAGQVLEASDVVGHMVGRMQEITSVATRALPRSAVSVTAMEAPFRWAPPPRTAVNSSSLMGFSTTPTTTCAAQGAPAEMPQ